MNLYPSHVVWSAALVSGWRQRTITPLSVATAIACRIANRPISGMATAVLRDLGLIGKHDKPNKKGREALATYLSHKYLGDTPPLEVVAPQLPSITPLAVQKND